MATPTIPNGEEYFFPIIYEGNGAGQRVGNFIPFTDSGTIANSVIFNDADSARLERTPSSGGNQKVLTVSMWFKLGTLGVRGTLFSAAPSGDTGNFVHQVEILSATQGIRIQGVASGSTVYQLDTNRIFEDTSKFYHILVAYNTGDSTANDRIKLYIDGTQVTSFSTQNNPAQDLDTLFNATSNITAFGILAGSNTNPFDGYIAEVNLVDGTALTPSTFGLTDTSTGRWIPKTLTGITYGTNGVRLTFADSSALGDDTSGNTNDFSSSGLVAGDQTTDSPTQNFATGTATADSGNLVPHTISEGNLTFNNPNGTSGRGFSTARSTLRLDPKSDTGYYCEVKVDTTAGGNGFGVGVTDVRVDGVQQSSSDGYFGAGNNFQLFQDSFYFREINGSGINVTDASTFPAFTTGDTLGLAFKSGKLWIAKNNTWYNSGNPSTGANPLVELSKETLYRFCLSLFGMNLSGAPKGTYNFGQKSLTYTPPTGFVALQQDNMPETDKGVTGLSWVKNRDQGSNSHGLTDSSRGPSKVLFSNTTDAEQTYDKGLTKFLKGGYACGEFQYINGSGDSLVSWSWVANGGTTASNSNGSITSTTQANTTAGFSIVTYTGTGSNATVGHGLSSPPTWLMVKGRTNSVSGFTVGSATDPTGSGGFTQFLYLNETEVSRASSSTWNDTAPTSSVFSIGSSSTVNASSVTYVAYCWHDVEGFSKFGTYTGNGNANGPFIYTGFKPAWIMTKRADSADNWQIQDNARNPFNGGNWNKLSPDLNSAESSNTNNSMDILSNGFKLRHDNGQTNASSGKYLYFAFAENPFVGDGTNPVTAR